VNTLYMKFPKTGVKPINNPRNRAICKKSYVVNINMSYLDINRILLIKHGDIETQKDYFNFLGDLVSLC
jgi:hypothetical protein